MIGLCYDDDGGVDKDEDTAPGKMAVIQSI